MGTHFSFHIFKLPIQALFLGQKYYNLAVYIPGLERVFAYYLKITVHIFAYKKHQIKIV